MAFSSNGGDDDAPMADINVTPLVDVMLVLLIVFMITMPVLTHSIPLNLPTTTSKQTPPKQDTKPTGIAIDKDGLFTFGADSQEKESLETLKKRLQELHKTNPDTVIAISADEETDYRHMTQILEAVHEAGFSKVGFVTKIQK